MIVFTGSFLFYSFQWFIQLFIANFIRLSQTIIHLFIDELKKNWGTKLPCKTFKKIIFIKLKQIYLNKLPCSAYLPNPVRRRLGQSIISLYLKSVFKTLGKSSTNFETLEDFRPPNFWWSKKSFQFWIMKGKSFFDFFAIRRCSLFYFISSSKALCTCSISSA